MIFRRTVSALLILVTVFSLMPVGSAATEDPNVTFNGENATITGNDSFGSLLADEVMDSTQSGSQQTNPYCISDVTVIGKRVAVEYSAAQDALLVVAIYSENRAVLHASVQTQVSAQDYSAEIALPEEIPEYFQLSAYLLHPTGLYPLCDAYESAMYTSWMQDLLRSTVDDYDPELVWNFDEDTTTNFGVFYSSVIRVTPQEGVNRVVEMDNTAHRYVIEAADKTFTKLEKGNIVWYPYSDGKILVFKVDTVTVSGSTVTIIGAPLEMNEIFSHLKLETISGDTPQEQGITPRSGDVITGGNEFAPFTAWVEFSISKEDGLKFKAGENVEISPHEDEEEKDDEKDEDLFGLKLEGTVKLSFNVSFYYYIAKNYTNIRFTTQITNHMELTVGGEFKPVNLKFPELGLPILNGAAYLSMKPTFSVAVGIQGTFSWTTYPQFGFYLKPGMLLPKPLNRQWKAPEFGEPKFEGSISVGIKWENSLSILDIGELELAKFTLPLETGVSLKIEPQIQIPGSDENHDPAEGEHVCGLCYSITLDLKIKLSIGTELCEFIDLELTLLDETIQLAQFYYSVTAKQEGKADYCGEGPCPYWGHRVTVIVQDLQGEALAGIPVFFAENGVKSELGFTDATGSIETVLTRGTYSFFTDVDGITVTEEVYLEGREVIVLSALNQRLQEDPDFFREYTNADKYTHYGELKDGGTCGAQGGNVLWYYYEGKGTRTLVIVGSGEMWDYPAARRLPWEKYGTILGIDVVVEPGITYIGTYAFSSMCVESAKLPNSLIEIGAHAFEHSWFNEIQIPEQVRFIGDYAFESSGLDSIVIPDNVERIGKYAFASIYDLKTAVISNNVTTLEWATFENCNLEKVTLPENLEYIGGYCFQNCTNLQSLTLPDTLRGFGQYAFMLTGIEEIDIPKGVTVIPSHAFASCKRLKRVGLPEGLISIGDSSFGSCFSLTDIDFPSTLENLGYTAFQHCTSLTQIFLPKSLKVMSHRVFQGCDNLRYVVFWGDCPNRLSDLLDDPTAVGWGPIYSPLQSIHPNAVVYYPADAAGWTEENIDDMDYESETITWIPFHGTPPAPEAYELTHAVLPDVAVETAASVTAESTGVKATAEASLVPTGYNICEVEFVGLQPDRVYMVLVVADPEATDLLAAENLLYLAQATSDSEGRICLACFTPGGEGVAIAYTAPWKNIADAQIRFPEVTANGDPQLVLPTVIYAGEELVLGADYSIIGDIRCTEAGEYTCVIQGINNFTGTITCVFNVMEQTYTLGDVNEDGSVDIFDANLIASFYNEVVELSENQLAAADVNGDGSADIFDANLVAAYYNEVIDNFPAE